jgi:Flp pilus assembly protein TadB
MDYQIARLEQKLTFMEQKLSALRRENRELRDFFQRRTQRLEETINRNHVQLRSLFSQQQITATQSKGTKKGDVDFSFKATIVAGMILMFSMVIFYIWLVFTFVKKAP